MEQKTDNKVFSEVENLDERVTKILTEMKIKDGTRVCGSKGLLVGDTFGIIGIDKIGAEKNGFVPFVFLTDTNKVIGVKHFGQLDFGDAENVPTLGNTAKSTTAWMLWANENKIRFRVDNIRYNYSKPIKQEDSPEPTYPKEFLLSIV